MPNRSRRQAQMRKRLARDKKSAKRQAMHVEDNTPGSQFDDEPQREPTIIKEPNGSTTVSRQDLYNLIWREPFIKIRFGVSDVAIASHVANTNSIT